MPPPLSLWVPLPSSNPCQSTSGSFKLPIHMSGPLDDLPLWGLLAATVALVLGSIEAGFRIGRFRRRRSDDEKEPPVGAIVGATLALFGFVLAFTFGMAASRFDARRHILVEEANSISTTYLRAGMLPDGRGAQVRRLLKEYVDERLAAARTRDLKRVLSRSDELHQALWYEAEAVGRQHTDSITVGLFVQSLNETIDLHSERILVTLQSRIPAVLWGTIALVTVMTMAGVGYLTGLSRSTRPLANLVLAFTFSSVIYLIADLDRPGAGVMEVSNQAMQDARNMMNRIR
jgi:hypothetical protein